MKTSLLALAVICASGAAGVVGQTVATDDTFETTNTRRAEKTLVVIEPEPQNRIVTQNVTYSGIAVAVVKADNKLQLLNPVAPAKYGTAEDSVARDPITGGITGLKFFSISF